MKQGYKPVLALKLFHEYYKNGSTQDFSVLQLQNVNEYWMGIN